MIFRGRWMNFANEVGIYVFGVVLLSLSNLILLPVTVRVAAGDWTEVAVGQASGVAIATIVGGGYGLNGPGRILRGENAAALYLASLRVRSMLMMASVLLSLPFLLLTRSFVLALAASPIVFGAFSANFVFVGTRRPIDYVVSECLPRAVANLAAAAGGLLGFSLEAVLLVQLSGVLVGLIFSGSVVTRATRVVMNDAPFSVEFRGQISATLTAAGSAVQVAGPTLVVSILTPAALPAFAFADRLARQLATAVVPLNSALQSRVASLRRREFLRILRYVRVLLPIAVAVTALIGFAAFSPIARLLAGPSLEGQSSVLYAASLTYVLGQFAVLAITTSGLSSRGFSGEAFGVVLLTGLFGSAAAGVGATWNASAGMLGLAVSSLIACGYGFWRLDRSVRRGSPK